MWLNVRHASPTVGVVDDRREFLDVVDEQPVEERLVAIVQRNEPDALLQIIRLAADMLKFKLHLLLDGGHPPGQQPAKAELISFPIGEWRRVIRCVRHRTAYI